MEISSTTGMLVGFLLAGLAGCNVVLMLEAGRTRNPRTKNRLLFFHRVNGYAFIILYSMMAYVMSQRLAGEGLTNKLPTHIVLHVVLAVGLVPLLLLKVSIVRRYTSAHFLLMPLGFAIFATSAVLVALPAFSELLRSAHPGSLRFKVAAVLILALSLVLCGSAVRSTIRSLFSPHGLGTTRKSTQSAQENANSPMTLRLVGIAPETHNAKTFRFFLPRKRLLQAKPGQFLTFHWIIDGQRAWRSYTISSSPVCTDHVEITPKRVENGCVSNFLHNHAKAGLTVAATGPYGRFYFDETLHRSIVLIAAGVGITPMISILRYIADLGLSNPATLLYCVRTRRDIIFETELERLRECLPNFNYAVSLSQPDAMWTGSRGHLTRAFILEHLTDLDSPTFFLCGPRGFMNSARLVLRSFGVNSSRITEESFGETAAAGGPAQGVAQSVSTVEFVLSKKVCEFPAGSSLLEVAEQNGVSIPFGCRQGQCGTCATRTLSGAVHMDTDAGLTADQKSRGYVLPCVSRAQGNVMVQS